MLESIVIGGDRAQSPSPPPNTAWFETGLWVSGPSLSPRLVSAAHAKGLDRSLAFRVARRPGDLESHLRRIRVNTSRGDPEATWGAVVDLFIALGPCGLALRRRVLEQTTAILGPERTRRLGQRLVSGIQASEVAFATAHSRLCRPLRPAVRIVDQAPMPVIPPRDPLEESRALLDSGQVPEAQALLEEALVREPRRLDLSLELLEIYRRLPDAGPLLSLRERLTELPPEAAAAWDEAAGRQAASHPAEGR